MSLLKSLFSLDTLDKRLSTPSRRALASRVEPDPAKPQAHPDLPDGASPPLWRTKEFYLYYLVFIICVPLMFKAVYDVSQPDHPNYKNFEDLLSPGWIPGRKVDNSDSQYSSFRDNIPYLFVLLIAHPLLRKVYNAQFPAANEESRGPGAGHSAPGFHHSALSSTRLEQRLRYDFGFAVIFLCALHGFSAIKIMVILSMNYWIAKRLPSVYVVPMTWLFNITTLFANELCKGYPYTSIANDTFPFTVWDPNSNWGTFFDHYGGLMPRWEILFNFTVLRLISFNMDYHWSQKQEGGQSLMLEKKQLDPSNLSERDRVNIPAMPEDYSFRNYLAYTLYAPLYLAGPILTFNEYISQNRYAPKSIDTTRTIRYGIRFLLCLLTMELVLHFIYAVAIFNAKPDWAAYTPLQLSMLGFFNLHIIWLKLLLPWRFFRLWALTDGIDPPENMVRCMSNNYSALAFWRGWHRSYNRWIVRYLYVPLGGSDTKTTWGKIRSGINYLSVFIFVALWHDIQLRLLMWGWLISLFVLPEVLGAIAFPRQKWQNRKTAYRLLCGAGAVVNILLMMAANLVGFAIGLDGLQGLVQGIVGSFSGVVFLLTACGALFVGAQVMFEVREEEMRHGIRLKC